MERSVLAFHSTVRPEITNRRGEDVLIRRLEESASLKETILKLRTVKYGKVLVDSVRKSDLGLPDPSCVFVLRRPLKSRNGRLPNHCLIVADVVFVLDENEEARDAYLAAAQNAATRRPASKFGIVGELSATGSEALSGLMRGRALHLYLEGQTHKTRGKIGIRELWTLQPESWKRLPPILSNVEVCEEPRELSDGVGDRVGDRQLNQWRISVRIDPVEVFVDEAEAFSVDNLGFG